MGYEFKYAERPQFTRSMWVAMEDLRLDSLLVICPGPVLGPLAPGVEVVGIETFAHGVRPHPQDGLVVEGGQADLLP